MSEGAVLTVLALGLSVAPALLLLRFFRRFDRVRPASNGAVLMIVSLGAMMCLPAVVLELSLRALLGDLTLLGGRAVDAFLVVALTEESLKLAVVLGYAFRRPLFNEVADGVVFSVASSLGFGMLENLLLTQRDVGTALVRAVLAVPMHALASGAMGYFVGRARFVVGSSRVPLLALGLAVGVLIHGAYDWAVFARSPGWALQCVAVLLGAAALLTRLLRHAARLDDAMLGRASLVSLVPEAWPGDLDSTLAPESLRSAVRPPDAVLPQSKD